MGTFFANNQQLLWGVNTSLRRRLTLMLLFGGAVFIMLAGTIRAVTILTVSLSSIGTSICFANTAPLSPVQTAQSAVAHGLAVKPSSLSSSQTYPSSILYFDRLQKPSVSAVSSPGTANRDRRATPCRAKLESSTRTQAGSRVSIHFRSPTTLLGVATSVSCLLIARTTQRRRRLMAASSLHKKLACAPKVHRREVTARLRGAYEEMAGR